jgi:hypothetical protein
MADDFLSKLRLKDSKESSSFKPFKVSSTMNTLLKPIVDAFENSDKVTIGYSTLEKNKGLTKPTLKRKTIYLLLLLLSFFSLSSHPREKNPSPVEDH